jgi:prepilin-type N-terminal cleavage/methylation domain-containing protein
MSFKPYAPSKMIKSEDGYSLIEVIIAMQLFVIVMTLLYSVFSFSQRFTIKWLSDSNQWQERLVKLNYLEKELSSAREITDLKPTRIDYLNDEYITSSIYWAGDSVHVGNHILRDLRIERYKTYNHKSLKNIESIVIYFKKDSVFIAF